MKDPLVERDLSVNWHPYTQMKDHEGSLPIFITKAKGAKLYDNKGSWYYDTISSWWCNVHGHGHPAIMKAIKGQLKSIDHVMFAGFTHKPAIELSEKLLSVAPKNLKRVFYSDNGSTAVETALKMSVAYWKNTGKPSKKRFVSLDMGYHGDTAGTMSLGGIDVFTKTYQSMFFKAFKVPSPYCYRCPCGKDRKSCSIDCIKPLAKLLKSRNKEIAGLIIEPLVLGAAGMIIYPEEYLKKAAALCKKYGIHLIADEVATGFGRTGMMFACQKAGVNPDFMCLSKGLTGGTMALGATLATEKIYKAFYADYSKRRTFYHGHTFTANPVACSAALVSIRLLKKDKSLKKVDMYTKLFKSNRDRFLSLPNVGDVRLTGTVFALELVRDKKTKKPFSFEDRVGNLVYRAGLKNNIILRPLGNVVYLFLPLCLDGREVKDVLDRMYVSVRQAVANLPKPSKHPAFDFPE